MHWITRLCLNRRCIKAVFAVVSLVSVDLIADDSAPNIVWIMAEDISTDLACYGETAVETPNLDKLAGDGIRYTHAFCTAPSCTPSRNAMMTGVYQTRTDTQDQRRGGVTLPEDVKPITHWLRESGYYTSIGCGYSDKTDLNFDSPNLFDGKDWKGRKPNQPFFAQITLGATHRHGDGWPAIRESSKNPVNPDDVKLPPYLPDHPSCRKDWALYLDAMQKVDHQVGEILERLEREQIADQTVVIFIGDNGRCHLRGKCWLYDAGIRVPLIIRWPGRKKSGMVDGQLVSMVDVSATVLEIAKAHLPESLDGVPLIGPKSRPRDCIFAARDQIDEVVDHIRCVRTDRFKYIRNYVPEIGYRECEYVQNHRPMLSAIHDLNARNKLLPVQKLMLAANKPDEELYDLEADPFELNNLAAEAKHAETLEALRLRLDQWISDTSDTGLARLSMDKVNQ